MMRPSLFIRAIVIMLLIASGVIMAISGVVLYFAPSGPGSGNAVILGATKHFWNNLHTYTGFSIIGLATAHVILNRRSLLFYTKKLLFS
ncbi:conserved hypothetical protein [Pyrobaculum neutrophilum V24Sta]|uniref:Flavinylation-associated cytochrome domain-containing protein n=2 Tax=Pyrobaculum neutrophilum TaxID=70771 RepID=B1Y8M3_PYRNV|nr:conserved hypothetical protein [Pyrobaculum neutrophilum V24Sta]